MLHAVVAVGAGAALGAWLRWGLAVFLNNGLVPMGTLAANLLGGYLMGVAMAFFLMTPSLSEEWKLLITTGFLGGLTTFSTFSAEAFTLINRHHYILALSHALSHVLGSILMTGLGYFTVQYLKQHA